MELQVVDRRAQDLLKRALKAEMELAARVRRRRFYCAALAGEREYNVTINADMSVSCNCRDFDGSGKIGDLSRATLDEVFADESAARMRRSLARGRLPLINCSTCPSLRHIPAAEADAYARCFRVPTFGVFVENTVACNYRCLGCRQSDAVAARSRRSMSLEDIERVAAEVRRHGIGAVWFFNFGEPFACNDVEAQLTILRRCSPELQIWISTNGSLLDSDSKRRGALLANRIQFSIAGSDDATLSRYQRGGTFEGAYGNMRELVAMRDRLGRKQPLIEWKYVLFRWNEGRVRLERAMQLARQADVDLISFWPARVPLSGVPWRSQLSPWFQGLGQAGLRKRQVFLRGGCDSTSV